MRYHSHPTHPYSHPAGTKHKRAGTKKAGSYRRRGSSTPRSRVTGRFVKKSRRR